MNRLLLALVVILSGVGVAVSAVADEGMWTFDGFPSARVKAAYGVNIDRRWLDRVQAATVRIPGCSASVVSKDGLILTNNHCVTGCLVALSDSAADRLKDGFLTDARTEERTCPGMFAEILVSVTDVTAKINAATIGKTGNDFVQARDAASLAAEAEVCKTVAAGRCQTINLYRGGKFAVYRYRRFTDVRMVFAPEFAAASKGLAANQGLYNGFLVAGLVWGLSMGAAGIQVKVFFLGCVVVAGLFGGATVNRAILFVQAIPGIIALALLLES